jgi:hypothetical protein
MHTPDWRASLRELCRVAADRVVFDYPSMSSAAALQAVSRHVIHKIKPSVEAYRVFSGGAVTAVLRAQGFDVGGEHKQFVLPIAFHKLFNSAPFTRGVEGLMSQTGLMRLFGSPVTVVARRCAS